MNKTTKKNTKKIQTIRKMVLCEIQTVAPRRPNVYYNNYTHTNRHLTPRGTTRAKARRQISHVHRYYIDLFPNDDQTVRDCRRFPPHLIRRRYNTRNTRVEEGPFRRHRRRRRLLSQ